ncbi:MAG TPA: hypothetical protein VG738_07780 [Chitinophagaceae bacterium]|nr:hypothetical protein [Chitinophagaceae bacterium]
MRFENKTTIDLIYYIVQRSDIIKGVYIHSYPNAIQLQERISFNILEQKHYANALKLRDEHNVPFWDSLMLSFYNKKDFSVEILNNVLDTHAKRTLEGVPREDVLNNKLLEFSESPDNYAINSRVETFDKKIRHLLLLDFHIPVSDSNQEVVETVLRILQVGKGFLLISGKSYHFLGEELITNAAMTRFLGKCLFFSPIIDKSWIGHQLIDRSCSIRFTDKNGVFPTFRKYIEY